jgi:hypothetical protein
VYSPVWSIVPTPAGLIVHVTAVLLEFATLAENCCVDPELLGKNVALAGVTLIDMGGISVTVAEPSVAPA